MAVQYQPIPIRFTAGLDTKSNAQASKPPSMDVLQNMEFDQIAGYQKRKPFGGMPNAIQGGGTLANCRGEPFSYRGELCVFTSDTLYSYNEQQQFWVPKGTHLAVKVTEQSVFGTAGDQIDSDRAELNGTIVYAWSSTTIGATATPGVFAAAVDKATGAVLVAPTLIANSVSRPRLVALATKILLVVVDTTSVRVRSIDPASPATGIASAGTSLVGGNFTGRYDMTRVIGADVAVIALAQNVGGGANYTIGTITAAGVPTTSSVVWPCTGSIGVSCTPDGLKVQVARENSGFPGLQGDLITIATLATVFVNQNLGPIGAGIRQLAMAHKSVLVGGFYQCKIFYTTGGVAADGSVGGIATTVVDTNSTVSAGATGVLNVELASRAFDYNGRVYFWVAFAGISSFSGANAPGWNAALQNSYFLYRDDMFLCAKAVDESAGGNAPTTGHLSGVALVSGTTGFAWCGTTRRIITLGVNQSGYAERAPRDVVFTFDSNEARRTGQFGETQIIAAGEVLQYDGVQLVELGYHTYPWFFTPFLAGAGNLANGVYAVQATWAWTNAQGELDRSTTATVATITVAGGPLGYTITSANQLTITHRTDPSNPVRDEYWRTQVNANPGASFYLTSSQDPTVTANPNRFIFNDPTTGPPTLRDAFADAVLTTLQEFPENGGALEHLAPPAASIILVTKDRVFLAGIAGSPDSIWYSRLKTDGEVASFNDFLQIQVGPGNGAITGMEFVNETLIVFRQFACYAYAGQGFDNTGGGQNFNGIKISDDIGAVNAEGIARIENAILFKSSKGWYQVGQNLQLTYVGAAVAKFDSDTPLSCVVMETQHQVRCLTNNRMLVWDTLVNNWAEWTINDGLGSCIWQGQHVYLTATGPKIQALDFTGVNYGFVVEMAFLTPADLQGSSHVRSYMVLGEYRGDHKLQLDTCRDYLQDGAGNWLFLPDAINKYTPSPTIVGSAYQVRHGPSVVRYQAIKVRLTELLGAGGVWTEGARLTGITFDAGSDGKAWPFLPASQKA